MYVSVKFYQAIPNGYLGMDSKKRSLNMISEVVHVTPTVTLGSYLSSLRYIVMYKTIFVINIILHMCLQHSNTL